MGHWVLLWGLAFLTKEQGLIPSFCKLKKICVLVNYHGNKDLRGCNHRKKGSATR